MPHNNFSLSNFPDYIQVIPSAPAVLADSVCWITISTAVSEVPVYEEIEHLLRFRVSAIGGLP